MSDLELVLALRAQPEFTEALEAGAFPIDALGLAAEAAQQRYVPAPAEAVEIMDDWDTFEAARRWIGWIG